MTDHTGRQDLSDARERITDEIVRALTGSPSGIWRVLLGPLFRLSAGRFARIMVRADGLVRASGLPGGAQSLLRDLRLEPVVWGAERVPRAGPLVVAANHPGAYDSLAFMAAIPRADLKLVISDAGVTRAFPAARERFIFAPKTVRGRALALRGALRHLEDGGALLIYPHTEVEPDPEIMPGARQALEDWSPSLEIMLRRTPAARLQLAIASGILLPRFVRNPLVRLRKGAAQRQKLAEFLQVSWHLIFPERVRPRLHLSFAAPVDATALPAGRFQPAIIEAARRLLETHLASVRGTSG
jgi:hypothetical protein